MNHIFKFENPNSKKKMLILKLSAKIFTFFILSLIFNFIPVKNRPHRSNTKGKKICFDILDQLFLDSIHLCSSILLKYILHTAY